MNPHETNQDSSATRRCLLRWGGFVGLAPLAGCTRDVGAEFPPNAEWHVSELTPDLPVREQSKIVADRIEATSSADVDDVDAFVGAVNEYGLAVESVERVRDVLVIEYVTTERFDEGTLHDVATTAGAYAALVDAGDDAVALGITILDDAPESYGVATVETVWARAYNAGEFSAREYGERVAGTVQSKRHPPDVPVSPDE